MSPSCVSEFRPQPLRGGYIEVIGPRLVQVMNPGVSCADCEEPAQSAPHLSRTTLPTLGDLQCFSGSGSRLTLRFSFLPLGTNDPSFFRFYGPKPAFSTHRHFGLRRPGSTFDSCFWLSIRVGLPADCRADICAASATPGEHSQRE